MKEVYTNFNISLNTTNQKIEVMGSVPTIDGKDPSIDIRIVSKPNKEKNNFDNTNENIFLDDENSNDYDENFIKPNKVSYDETKKGKGDNIEQTDNEKQLLSDFSDILNNDEKNHDKDKKKVVA
ncbi:hypothetical protein [Lumpy skin disease virus]|uniref:Uncharacterized protein n=1 Tax=Lumpy skin disease virus TaxID=59509 RepID=A0A1B3B6E2_LSDV|nr:hypothetical protein LSDVgp129 [Lumpy skin disease virus NI-2490]AOE47705.1 hypothetical protein [Lumpy skin disease virus]AAK85090.1 LSDV129 hypothetical protein [Lumpy skin disease virus NI-2490]QEJ78676.1 hypothetical protein LSD-Kenya_129 [Lumpy skin disease virus]QTO66055.1 hypothetical protein [Lumpy skin disease virus]UJQ44096.1 hypothetical protein LSDVP10_00025 [Lumpy skin disease virus]